MTDTYTALKELLLADFDDNEPDTLGTEAAEAITTLERQLAEAREALPDYIDLFRIIRDAGRTDAAKADAVARAIGTRKDTP
jgi:hypothetical protein